jgi:hypothetical protein
MTYSVPSAAADIHLPFPSFANLYPAGYKPLVAPVIPVFSHELRPVCNE